MSVRRLLITGFACALLQGCMAIGPKFEPLSSPDAAVTKIAVYRPADFANSGTTPHLYVDGTKVAEITNGGYVVLEVKPGVHRLHLSLPNWAGEAASFSATRGGDISYFRVSTSYRPYEMRTFQLQRVSAVDAAKEIAETRRVDTLPPRP